MFFVRKPKEEYLRRLRQAYRDLPLTYPEAGCTRGAPPSRYTIDHNRAQLGRGAVVFERAKQALRSWQMLRLGWVEPSWPEASPQQGSLIGTLTALFGLWSLNVCRIVYVVEEAAPVAKFGFAYGTLPGHVECGEERFTVEWHVSDDAVWYDLFACSTPGLWLTRLGYPLTRRLQRRFAIDSMRAMVKAVD